SDVCSSDLRVGSFLEPVLHQFNEQLLYLPVRKRQFHLLARKPPPLSQVTGGIQDTPDIINGILNVPVSQLLSDIFHNRSAIEQLLNFIPRSLICPFQQTANKIISTGIRPIVFRFSIPIPQ